MLNSFSSAPWKDVEKLAPDTNFAPLKLGERVIFEGLPNMPA